MKPKPTVAAVELVLICKFEDFLFFCLPLTKTFTMAKKYWKWDKEIKKWLWKIEEKLNYIQL